MKIKTQFILTMLLFGATLVIIAASAVIMDLAMKDTLEQEGISRNITQGAGELGYLAQDYLIYSESQQLKRWQSRFTSFSEQVGKLKVDAPAQRALVQNIQANQRRLKEVFDSVVSALGNSSTTKKATLDSALLQVSWSRMAVQSQGLVSDSSRLSQLLDQQVEQLTETRTRLIYFLVGLLGVFLLFSYMFTHRRILKSITALQAGTKVIGYGYLDFKIEEKNKDEIGDLSRAFNQMAAGLKAVTASKTDLEREIAERNLAVQALEASEERFRTLYSSMNEGVAIHEIVYEAEKAVDYFIIDVNPAYERITGLDRDFAVRRSASELYGTGEAPYLDIYARVALTKEPTTFETYFPPMKKHFAISVFSPDKGKFATVFQDITERKQAEETLRKAHDELEKRVQKRTIELSETVERLRVEIIQRKQLEATLRESENQVRFFASQCLTAQETERRRIAGELHDGIAASLAATKFGIERASEELKRGNTDPEPLRDLAARLTGIISEVRRIMADLRPSILDDLGIVAAMNWFCREYKSTYSHISVEQNFRIEEHEVPDSLKTPIFRISQEAMNNIAKYSKASVVNLSLRKDESRIQLTIQDDGQGFNMETVRKGLGFSTMRERAELSGGECRIESTSGAGTTVECSWPIPR
ncbi:MAG: ATP-binding protein [Deltaproteobacteria bacterium]